MLYIHIHILRVTNWVTIRTSPTSGALAGVVGSTETGEVGLTGEALWWHLG